MSIQNTYAKALNRTAPILLSCVFFIICTSCSNHSSPSEGMTIIRNSGSALLESDLENPELESAFFDLDALEDDSDFFDIQFGISKGSQILLYLKPVNRALSLSMGEIEPGFNMCLDSLDLYMGGSIPDLSQGNYICLLTNEGRLAQLLIREVKLPYGSTKANLHIDFLVWENIIILGE